MPTQKTRHMLATMLACATVITGCTFYQTESTDKSKSAPVAKPAPKPARTAQLETGRAAFQKVYASARMWTPDAQPLILESQPREGDKDGQAAVWNAGFASAGKRSARNFTWSGATGEDAPEQGISLGRIDVYSPENASTQTFSTNFLKVDSDKAFETAQKHGGAGVLKKNPALLPKYTLVWDPQNSRLLWRITYGASPRDTKLRVLVDASTDAFVKLEK